MKTKMSISNDILNQALIKYQIERIEEKYPSIEYCSKHFKPNKKTEEKINKSIRLEKNPCFILINTMGKRVACIVTILFIAMTTTLFSVKALREPFMNFMVETYEKFSAIIFNNSESHSSESAFLTEIYEPVYIPDGYTKSLEEKFLLSYFCEYTNKSSEIIIFEQNLVNNLRLNIDTENSVIEKVYINNVEAIFYENKGQNHIVLRDNQYAFSIAGNIEKSELIKVAESIEKNK